MTHSKVRLWTHVICCTKYRYPCISFKTESIGYALIRKEFINLGCYVDMIKSMPDHIHVLFLLNPGMSIRAVMKQIKGFVSHAINQNKIIPLPFAWSVGYAAFSVSESTVPII
ncbi:MAG: IS200/IS605 family transposase [Saprospiraceae bacterium]|nr:IS200/IS605 family transposase [Saprospiraceae bacterium]